MQHVGGKLQLFQYSIPNVGVGKVKARDQHQLYGTDREPALRQPEDAFYKRFAADCSRQQV
jgi:protein transport protein SEC24